MMNLDLVDLIEDAVDARVGPNSGLVLSGGLDSSTVTALAPALPTFTGYYDVPGFSEVKYAQMVAKGPHHLIEITPQDFVDNFDAMVPHVPRPLQGMGTFGQFMVAKYLSEHGIEIALSGEGSDELFGGYARTLLAAGEPMPEGYENYKPPADYPVEDLEAALQYDLDRLPDLLAVDDAMCAAWGIEARAPFTDQRIVDYALALKPTQRVGKRHLREAVRGIVPDAIIDRTDKMGFPAPLALWAQVEPVKSFVMDRIGYLPDPETPWHRDWWYDMIWTTNGAKVA
jgi:asparagine synthetase B (glutamine-hydrolysing)